MPKKTVPAPVLGVSDATPFIDQPGAVTVPDGLENVVYTTSEGGGTALQTRPRVVSEYDGGRGTGPVQAIGSIPIASGISGTTLRNIVRQTTGESRPAGTFKGQALWLDPDGSVRLVLHDSRGTGATVSAPPTGAGGFGSFNCCVDPDNPDIGYFITLLATNTAVDATKLLVGVNRCSLATNAISHQAYCYDAGPAASLPVAGAVDLFANQVSSNGTYVFVCAFRYVYVFKASDLTYVNRLYIDWTEEVQGVKPLTVDGVDYLLVLATGNFDVSGPVVTDSGPAPTERFGEFYRSSIMVHQVQYADSAGTALGSGGTPLVRKAMPMGLAAADAGYEDHRSFRPSEWSFQRLRGCIMYAFDVAEDEDGKIRAFIARTSQGFGYSPIVNTDQRPDGRAAPVSAACAILTRAFEADRPASMAYAAPVRYGFSEGVGGWEVDPNSILRTLPWGTQNTVNDIPAIIGGVRNPHETDNEPTLWAVAADVLRQRVFFAGRRSAMSGAAPNVFCLDMLTGDTLWEADVAGIVQQNAIAVDPTTGNIVVGMTRRSGFELADGSISGERAEVIVLNGENGVLVRFFDLTDAINLNGYIVDPVGIGCFGVAVNSRGQILVSLAPSRYDT